MKLLYIRVLYVLHCGCLLGSGYGHEHVALKIWIVEQTMNGFTGHNIGSLDRLIS